MKETFVLVFVGSIVLIPLLTERSRDSNKKDLEAMQGEWVFENHMLPNLSKPIEIGINRDCLSFRVGDERWAAIVKLDAGSTPKSGSLIKEKEIEETCDFKYSFEKQKLRLVFPKGLFKTGILILVLERKAQTPPPKKGALPKCNQVYVKIILPTDSAKHDKNRPVVESWIAEQLKKRGQLFRVDAFREVTLENGETLDVPETIQCRFSQTDIDSNAAFANECTVCYDADGNVVTGAEGDPALRGFYTWAGRELDVETQLQYNAARWYDPTPGRWINDEPLASCAIILTAAKVDRTRACGKL